MSRAQWIVHNGSNVFCIDWSYLKDMEYRDSVTAGVKEFLDTFNTKTGKVTILADVTRSVINKAALEALKNATQVVEVHCEKMAVLGVEGMKKVLLAAVNQISKVGVKPFATREEALNWLAEE